MSNYTVINPRKIPKGTRIFIDADGKSYEEGDTYAGTNAEHLLGRGFLKEAKGAARGKN